jgi:predicted Rossmann fold nucleotide-binding protein DprA/Smf involved in DNA uptake
MQAIRRRLAELPSEAVIVTGGARGADRMADEIAGSLGLDREVFPANWARDHKVAGYVRNSRMIRSKPDLVLAFWDGSSSGTRHTVKLARDQGVEVEVIEP